MQPRFIGGAELAALLSMERAIDEVDAAFAGGPACAPPRWHLDPGPGDLLLMPAWGPDAAGVKLVTVAPHNPQQGLPLIHGIYVLFDKPSLVPIALFDAAPLTALRTAAVSAVATRHLAREDARDLVLFGAGTQARAHLDAMRCVRPIDSVTIVSRSDQPARELARRATERGLAASVGGPDAVADADLVCTCTTSDSPVFDGTQLRAGAHVNAVGSYTRSARELDDAALRDSMLAVDVEIATGESGDLAIPLESGVIQPDAIALLSDVVQGRAGRTSDSQITVFKSVGAAFEDLAVAKAAADRL